MESAYDICVLCDANLRVVYVNPAGLARLTRAAQLEDVIGEKLSDVLPSIEPEDRHNSYLEVLETGRPRVIREVTPTPPGLVLEARVFKVEDGLGVIATDISERDRAEREKAELSGQLHQAQKMEAIGTLASGVAHDFNNLLMGIGGCTNIAIEKLEADNPASVYLREIKQSVESGVAISRQLLTFSRRKDVKRGVLELNGSIASAQRMLQRLLGEDIDLVIRPRAEDSRVRADIGQMEQVIMNLAVNARDAMPQGGRLEIETKNARFLESNDHSLPAGDYVILAVTDTGTGMTEEVRQRIFEPFFTTKEVGKGTGLGLSTVHGIIQETKGRIIVSSRPGAGTTFEIVLPKSGEAIDSERPPPIALRPGQGTVLLVEDERTVRMATRFYLEQGGYHVIEAENGSQAIGRLHEYADEVDLLLTDVVLRGMGGCEIAREVQMLRPKIRVLYMSAHAAELLENQGRLDRELPMIQKPFGPEALLLRIQQVLDAKPTGPAPADRASKQTILVVEDESSSRLAICEYLQTCGWEVLGAGDGPQALELCKGHDDTISILLTDYSLPLMKGDALARQIKQLYPDVRVAYMSGYPDLQLDPPGLVLTKPLDLDEVEAAVARLARG
jgi:signal transduction histidine kinase/DNA-binding response OmpR family regulator